MSAYAVVQWIGLDPVWESLPDDRAVEDSALAAYLAILALFAYAAVRAAGEACGEVRLLLVGVLAAAAGHLVTDAFMSPDLTGTWLFWLLLGSGVGVAAAERNQRCGRVS